MLDSSGVGRTLWLWNAEVFANLPGEIVVDFGVTRNCRCTAAGTDEDRMAATLPEQTTTILLPVADQRAPLHAVTLSGSRMTGPFPVACCANSRFASKIIETAS